MSLASMSSRISRLLLRRSLVHFRGQPFGTIAAASHTNSSDGSKQALPAKSPRFACLHSHSRGLSGFYGCRRKQNEIEVQAWINLKHSLVNVHGQPVGTIPAFDNSGDKPNHDRVFVRDFVPSALAFLLNGEPLIVKNFIKKTLELLSWGTTPVDHFRLEKNTNRNKNVDSGFWWIFLLRAYTVSTGDTSLVDSPECQKGIKLILNECLSESDPFPTLLCADGCCMMDRRMGINGYPIEIQALFFMALKCATILIRPDGDGNEILERILKRIDALSFHMRSYFWMDPKGLNDMYRYKTEEYSHTAANKFDIAPDSLPEWILDFLPPDGGYFLGNVGPWKMDFRWFCIGNCVAILSSLATQKQASAIMKLIDSRWNELVGEMPLKICYPAMENHEWRIVTGCDPKNTSWSNHNGGSWPVLLWLLTAASMKARRCGIGTRAIELAEKRLFIDNWPEYYDGKLGRFIGKHARKHQTQSVAGYLVAKMMLENHSQLGVVAIEEQ